MSSPEGLGDRLAHDLKPDPPVRSFIGQKRVQIFVKSSLIFQRTQFSLLIFINESQNKPTAPSALPLSVRTNSDLIHCSSAGNLSRQSVSFHSDKHAEKVLLSMNRLRKSEMLCDVSIKG
jgi:hypothetical protein